MKHGCGTVLEYNEEYDAYFCPDCDVWTEGACKDPDCEYCRSRPSKPSEALKQQLLSRNALSAAQCSNKPEKV